MSGRKMDMEGEEGTAECAKLASTPTGTSASVKKEGDEGHQVQAPGQKVDGDGGGVVGAEASDDHEKGAGVDHPSNEDADVPEPAADGLQLHPMQNKDILTNLFERSPPALLANFRLVCKQWRDLSLESWRSSITLRIDYNEGNVRLYRGRKYRALPLQQLINYVDKPTNQCLEKPFRRYNLVGDAVSAFSDATLGFEFPLEASKNLEIRKLWELVKRDATSLELGWCAFPIEVFRETIYKDLPNLRELKLSCCRIGEKVPSALLLNMFVPIARMSFEQFSRRGRKEPMSIGVYPEHLHLKSLSIELEDNMGKLPLEWLELFSQFPALTRLSVGICMPDEEPEDKPFEIFELHRVLEAIKAVREQDARKLPLKEFDILPYFVTSIEDKYFSRVFALLLELRLPLQSLQLCMESKQTKKVQKLTSEIDGSRFRSLTFYRRGISTWQFPFQLPLENLSKLVMADVIWENMEFLLMAPNLTKLEITDYDSWWGRGEYRKRSVPIISSTQKVALAEVKLLKLKDFTWGYALTEEDLRQLGNWFPNLTRLQTALDDKLFPIVCEQWGDLEWLSVDGAELTDQGVTGLKEAQVVEDLDTMELPPNIRLLQKLNYFRYPKSVKVTDVSVFNGFLKLPQLKGLTLGKGPTEKAKAAVKETKKINMYLELDRN